MAPGPPPTSAPRPSCLSPFHWAPPVSLLSPPTVAAPGPHATATNWSEADTEPCVDGWAYDRSTFTSPIVTEWDLVCDHQGLKPLGQSIHMAGSMVGCIVCGFLSHRFGRKSVLSWCCLRVAATSISTVAAPSFSVYCGLRFLSALGLSSILPTSAMFMVEWTMTSMRAVTMAILGSTYSIGQMAVGGLAFALQDWRTLQLAVLVPFFVIFPISCFFLTVLYYGIVLDLQNLGSDIFPLQVLFRAVDLLARAITTFMVRFFGRRTTLAGSLGGAVLAILANTLVPQDLQTLSVVFAVLGKGCFGLSLTCIMIYKPELFPTSLRIITEGFQHSAAQLGSVMGPLTGMTSQVLPLLPPLSYGVIPSAAGLMVLFLPETQGPPLPDTIQDLERQRSAAARVGQQEVVITESTWF